MRTLIIHIDSKTSKSKIKEQLKNVEGIVSISDKLTLSDIEDLADEKLIQEMKKADSGPLLSYEEGKMEFGKIKKSMR
jgi:hypothetical protein